MRSIGSTALVLLILPPALGLAACGSKSSSNTANTSTTPTPTQQKLTGPKVGVAFKSPRMNAKEPSTVTAKVSLTNFTIDKADVGKAPLPGKGHLHFSMDGGKFDTPKYSGPNGRLAVKLGVAGQYSPALAPKITYKHLPKGKHTLVVNLANNDHSITDRLRTLTAAAAMAAVAAALCAVGCGGGGDSSKPQAGGKAAVVSMEGLRFHPSTLRTRVGTTVVWRNDDRVDHNVTGVGGFRLKSKAFGHGGSYRFTPTKPGTLRYVCTLHPGMDGVLTVAP
jgi:plastocyanin